MGLRAQRAGAAEVRVDPGGAPGDLPAFLRAARGRGMADNRQLSAGRVMKARAVEHARYRAVADYPKDADIQAVLQRMRYAAREELPTSMVAGI